MSNIEYRGVRCERCLFSDPSSLFPGEIYHCKKFGFTPMKADDFCSKGKERKEAHYFETFQGKDYYKDRHGNIYTEISGKIAYCSNLKKGNLTIDKTEPYFEVSDVVLIKQGV